MIMDVWEMNSGKKDNMTCIQVSFTIILFCGKIDVFVNILTWDFL